MVFKQAKSYLAIGVIAFPLKMDPCPSIIHVGYYGDSIEIYGSLPGRRLNMLRVISMWGTLHSSILNTSAVPLKTTKPNTTIVVKGHDRFTYSHWSVISGSH